METRTKVIACLELHKLKSTVSANSEQVTEDSIVNHLFYFIESLLMESDFLCGSRITVADICWFQSIKKLINSVNEVNDFSNTMCWLERIEEKYPIQNRHFKLIGLNFGIKHIKEIKQVLAIN